MNEATYPIQGGDYVNGGSASKELKAVLKRIGVDAKTIRRTMVAAYEAEMNVVIHAFRGAMKVAVDPTLVDVAIEDEGPGIPSIDHAMTEGFSTAPPEAREMGFGAGMGLPNIRRNSDQFSIQSTVGQGTRVRFRVFLHPEWASAVTRTSLRVEASRCQQCLACLHACPTSAVRVRDKRPVILEHLCIDCTSCMAVCEAGALTLDLPHEVPELTADTVLVAPSAFFEQFGEGVAPAMVLDALREMGFMQVRVMEEWEDALRAAVLEYARSEDAPRPVLSPMCPAVVSLIQLRYPSLMGHLAPFLTPAAAAREDLTAPHVVFVATCPAQHTLLRGPGLLSKIDVVSPWAMVNAVRPHLAKAPTAPENGAEARASAGCPEGLEVSGMRHVIKVLEEVENGLLKDCRVLELYACAQGCFGSPVWVEDPFVARRRFERMPASSRACPDAGRDRIIRRTEPLAARAGLRLDSDMRRAIEKLARIDAIVKTLPGRDCGVCGAPTCVALAEDVVLGRAEVTACVFADKGLPIPATSDKGLQPLVPQLDKSSPTLAPGRDGGDTGAREE